LHDRQPCDPQGGEQDELPAVRPDRLWPRERDDQGEPEERAGAPDLGQAL
jgi:hypothetical protein